MLAERGREGVARLDRGVHFHERFPQHPVFGLLDEDREGAHEGKARVDEPRHLLREDGERRDLDALAEPGDRDLAVQPRLRSQRDLERGEALRAQLRGDGVLARRLDGAFDDTAACGVDRAVGVLLDERHQLPQPTAWRSEACMVHASAS